MIIGRGGLGRCVKDIAERMNTFQEISYLDDNSTSDDVIGKIDELNKYKVLFDYIYVAIGNNRLRNRIMDQIGDEKLINIIDPFSFVSKGAKLEKGLLIYPGTIIEDNSQIGKGSIISSNTVISHDVVIGRYNLIYSNTTIRPNVKTSDLVKIASNVVITEGKQISEDIDNGKVI